MLRRSDRILILVLVGMLLSVFVRSQSNVQIHLSPVSLHPFQSKENVYMFENNIDDRKLFLLEPLVMLDYENFLHSDTFSWQLMFGFLNDAAARPALTSSLGLKMRLFFVWESYLSVYVGVNGYARRSWRDMDRYRPGGNGSFWQENRWAKNGRWEYHYGWMAATEYAFIINDHNDIVVNVMYGHQPLTFTVSIGYKYWISTTIKHPKKCGNCPFQKKKKFWNI